MEALRTWGISLTAAAAVCMGLEILAPKTPLRKMLKLLIGVFFLSAIFSPILVKFSLGEIDYNQSQIAENSQKIEAATNELSENLIVEYSQNAVERQLDINLKNIGVLETEIKVFINISEQTGIFINSAVVKLPQSYKNREREIRDVVENTVGREYTLEFTPDPT